MTPSAKSAEENLRWALRESMRLDPPPADPRKSATPKRTQEARSPTPPPAPLKGPRK